MELDARISRPRMTYFLSPESISRKHRALLCWMRRVQCERDEEFSLAAPVVISNSDRHRVRHYERRAIRYVQNTCVYEHIYPYTLYQYIYFSGIHIYISIPNVDKCIYDMCVNATIQVMAAQLFDVHVVSRNSATIFPRLPFPILVFKRSERSN